VPANGPGAGRAVEVGDAALMVTTAALSRAAGKRRNRPPAEVEGYCARVSSAPQARGGPKSGGRSGGEFGFFQRSHAGRANDCLCPSTRGLCHPGFMPKTGNRMARSGPQIFGVFRPDNIVPSARHAISSGANGSIPRVWPELVWEKNRIGSWGRSRSLLGGKVLARTDKARSVLYDCALLHTRREPDSTVLYLPARPISRD